MVVELLVVADDLTGALDTGAQFARQGLRTLVTWAGAPRDEADVWVLDTESRDLSPGDARRRVAEAVAPLLPEARRLYKKVDSTLRGNVGAELEALLQATGIARALLAPAFPAQGRTTLHGQQLVHGVPLERAAFARPGLDSASIAALLRTQTSLALGWVDLEVVRQGVDALASFLQASVGQVLVVDAVEDADLAAVVRAAVAAGADGLLAGSAGLAAQLPGAWGLAGSGAWPRSGPVVEPILLVAGTQHPCLTCQVARLQARAPVTVVRQVLGGLLVGGEGVIAERSQDLAATLMAGGDAVLTTQGEPQVAGAGRLVAALLAQVASRALAQVRPGALVLTGGDVAMAACRTLGAEAIAVEGEIESGIPMGRLVGGPTAGLRLVTKAGGFGDDDVLWRILSALRG